MSQIGADTRETEARYLHFALARKRIANTLHHELGYAVRVLRLQWIFFIYRQRLGHGEPGRIVKTVDGKARPHDEPFHSGGKRRRYDGVTYAELVAQRCTI